MKKGVIGKKALGIIVAALVLSVGCPSPTDPTVDDLERLDMQESATLGVGETVTLEVTVVPSELEEEVDLVWESSDTDIASVSQDGVVTGEAAGEATITVAAQNEDISASASVTVTRPPLEIGPGGEDESAGGVFTETYLLISEDITWGHNSGSGSVNVYEEKDEVHEGDVSAYVDFSEVAGWGGLYFHIDNGGDEEDLTAPYADGALVFSLKGDVAEMEAKIESEDEDASLYIQDFGPEEVDGWKTYTLPMAAFKARNPSIDLDNLTVLAGFWNPHTADGDLVSDHFLLDHIYYTKDYERDIESIAVSPDELKIPVDGEMEITVTYEVDNVVIDSEDVAWSSDDDDIALVSDDGVITAIESGETTVEAEYEGYTAEVAVEVVESMPPEELDFDDDWSLFGMPGEDLTQWGPDTSPELVEDVHNRDKAIKHTLPGGEGDYGMIWRGDVVDLSFYDKWVVEFHAEDLDFEDRGYDMNRAVLELADADGPEPVETSDFDFPGDVSEPDKDGWVTVKLDLDDYASLRGVNLNSVQSMKFSTWTHQPSDGLPFWLEGEFYISEMRFE